MFFSSELCSSRPHGAAQKQRELVSHVSDRRDFFREFHACTPTRNVAVADIVKVARRLSSARRNVTVKPPSSPHII
jgi:hypothetical protein